MKKILLTFLSVIAIALYTNAVPVVTLTAPMPAYGCPNTTHDVSIGVQNTSGSAFPGGFSYTVNITFYVAGVALSPTNTQTFNTGTGVPVGNTQTVTIPAIPFPAGPAVCSVDVKVTSILIPGGYATSASYTVQAPPVLILQESPTGTVSLTSTLDAGYSTQFYLNGGSSVVNTSTTGSYTPTVSGTYTAKAYEAYNVNSVPSTVGCSSATASNGVTISVTTAIIDGQNVNVSVYPNPMASSLTISTGISYKLTYELSDMQGALLRTSDFTSVTNVNVENLRAGTYVLVIKDNNSKIASYKLVK